HTRWPRDWSSDVCSSDLAVTTRAGVAGWARAAPGMREKNTTVARAAAERATHLIDNRHVLDRMTQAPCPQKSSPRCSRRKAIRRSEEHTSELQSRGHLVC